MTEIVHFISYSSADGLEFAYRLHDALEGGKPSVSVWLDKRDMRPERDWDTQIDEAIAASRAVLFLMTPDSVEDQSVCKQEWSRALRYKKSVVPLLVQHGVKVPFRLENRQYIDFTDHFEQGLARLRVHLDFLNSPAGELQRKKDQRADAIRDLRRTDDELQKARIQDEITQLDAEIKDLQVIVDDPTGARGRRKGEFDEEIRPKPTPPPAATSTIRIINSPPSVPPDYFQDRHFETRQLAEFLRTDALRMMTVVGRGGLGKTAMVCRLLRALERRQLPDDLGEMTVDSIIYLLFSPMRRLGYARLLADLSKALPDSAGPELIEVQQDPKLSVTEKVFRVLEQFKDTPALILFDNFEDAVHSDGKLIDAELDEALRAFLKAPQHRVKLIITTRVKAHDLLLVQPVAQRVIELDKGLESPYAENVLRAMDASGGLGLKSAADEVLRKLQERTRGYPRALEALVAILAADRETQIDDLISMPLPENVVLDLVGEAFNRLDATAQRVIQALAIYGQPVSSVAVDYLLEPFAGGAESAELLKRLVNMHFVRQEGPRDARKYFLHPVDREYALERIAKGDRRDPIEVIEQDLWEFTRCCLYLRAAYYFLQRSLPETEWRAAQDLEPQLAAFEALLNGDDIQNAAERLVITSPYLLQWGHYRPLIELHQRFLDHELMATEGIPSELAVAVQGNLGLAFLQLGQPAPAIDYLDQAVGLAIEIEDLGQTVDWLKPLGDAFFSIQDLEAAVAAYQEGLTRLTELVTMIQDQLAELDESAAPTREEAAEQAALGAAYLSYLAGKRMEFAGALARTYGELGEVEQMEVHFREAIKIAHDAGDTINEDDLLASMHTYLGEVDEVIRHYEANLRLARGESNAGWEAALCSALGGCSMTKGMAPQAIAYYEQSREFYRALNLKRDEADILNRIGGAYEFLTRYEDAATQYKEAIVLAGELGDQQGQSAYLTSLGNVTNTLKQYDDAVVYFKQALEIAGMQNDFARAIYALVGLSQSYVQLGDAENALHYSTEALELARQTRNRTLELDMVASLGGVMGSFWRIDEEIQAYLQGLELAQPLRDRSYEMRMLHGLGHAYGEIGDIAKSIDYYEQALVMAQSSCSRIAEGSAHTGVGNAYSYLGRFDKMRVHYDAALAIARELKDHDGEIFGLVNLAEILRDQGRDEEAKAPIRQALAIAQATGSDHTKYYAHFDIALSHLFLGEIPEGLRETEAAERFVVPSRPHSGPALHGVLLLRAGEMAAARPYFEDALDKAAQIWSKESRVYGVWDVQALALSGLAVISAKQPAPRGLKGVAEYIQGAVEAYSKARAITSAKGIVNRVLRLHDALAVVAAGDADLMAQLAEVRKAAAGQA